MQPNTSGLRCLIPGHLAHPPCLFCDITGGFAASLIATQWRVRNYLNTEFTKEHGGFTLLTTYPASAQLVFLVELISYKLAARSDGRVRLVDPESLNRRGAMNVFAHLNPPCSSVNSVCQVVDGLTLAEDQEGRLSGPE